MSNQTPDAPPKSPVLPIRLGLDDKVQFACYKGISCFNACCRQADITLTPYDIIRLKRRLGLTSTEFLKRYTVPFEMDGQGMPGIKLRTEDDAPVCKLLDGDNGCSVYEDRPSACRYYPMGLLAMRPTGSPREEQHWVLVKEDHCRGHEEDNTLTVAQYRKEQGVEEYDEANYDWYRIILKKRSSGPTVGRPTPQSYHLFFMASYDMDKFREFIKESKFRQYYLLEDDYFEKLIRDDVELMKFGFRLLLQVLYGEQSIPLVDGALEKRLAERREIIEAKKKLAEELAKQEDPVARYIDD